MSHKSFGSHCEGWGWCSLWRESCRRKPTTMVQWKNLWYRMAEQASWCPTRMRWLECQYVGSPIPLVIIGIALPNELHPILFSLCIFIALWMPSESWAHKQAIGREWSCPLCSRPQVGVQRDRSLWSCNDRKGYSPEDQSIFPKETATYFGITAPPI